MPKETSGSEWAVNQTLTMQYGREKGSLQMWSVIREGETVSRRDPREYSTNTPDPSMPKKLLMRGPGEVQRRASKMICTLQQASRVERRRGRQEPCHLGGFLGPSALGGLATRRQAESGLFPVPWRWEASRGVRFCAEEGLCQHSHCREQLGGILKEPRPFVGDEGRAAELLQHRGRDSTGSRRVT